MTVIFLGTGAATPTLFRWPSSTAISRGGETLLFDCGEGAQVQFLRAKLRPGKLNRVFISHLHGDHFNGLIGLLSSLQLAGRDKRLHLYGPEGLADYLGYMQKLSRFTLGFPLQIEEVSQETDEEVWEMSYYTVTARRLTHRVQTLGFRLAEKPKRGKFDNDEADRLGVTSGPLRSQLLRGRTVVLPDGSQVAPEQVIGPDRPGKTIAICLDSAPCANAIQLAKDADLLIHEGTFDKSLTRLARETGHSTVVQAAKVAKQAGARRLVVTHISSRYNPDYEPELLAQTKEIFPEAEIAQDLMQIDV